MKRFLLVVLAAFLFFALLPLGAQTRGRVVDAAGQPVPYANIAALAPADSAVVAACLSGDDGYWQFREPVRPELLRVTAVGFDPLYYRVTAPVEQLTLTLRSDSLTALTEATVTYRRPTVSLKDGALVTSVEQTALSKAGTAEDVLRQVPGMVRKGDEAGSLEVIGRGKPLFYINGRQVRDLNELKQLSSEEIKSVEVIQNPGPRYDASVSAVVRIRTTRRKGEGWGVSLSNDLHQGKKTRNLTSLKLNYHRQSLDVYAGGSFSTQGSYWNTTLNQTTHTPDTLWFLPMGQRTESKMQQASFNTGFNYDWGNSQSIGMRYQLDHTTHMDWWATVDSRIQANGELYDELNNRLNSTGDNRPQHAVNAYYTGKIGKGELSIDADFFASTSGSSDHTVEQSAEFDDRDFWTQSRVRNRLLMAKAQYEWPWLGGKVALGVQYTFTNRHDDFWIPQNNFGVAAARSKQREQNGAAFVQYSALIAKRYQLAAGLRYEHAVYDYWLNGSLRRDQSPVYNNVFPSLSFATAWGKGKHPVQFMLAYAAQTVRPDYSQLSNNVTYGNRFLLQTGNPLLKPTIKHSVTATAVWNFLQGVAMFTHHTNGILNWGRSNPDSPAVTTVSYINRSYSQIMLSLTASPVLGWYRSQFNISYMQSFLKLPTLGREQRFFNPLLSINLNNYFELPAGFRLNVMYNLLTRGHYDNIQLANMMHYVQVGVSRSFLKDQLIVNVGCEDIFHSLSQGIYTNMESSRFYQKGEGETRTFFLKINYNLNAQRNRYKSKSEVQSVIDRL